PAPIVVGWIDVMNAQFVPWHDYVLADTFVVPDAEGYGTALARLPGTYLPFDTTRSISEPPPRAACGLPDDAVVLCAFHSTYKISPELFTVWCAILGDVP